MEKVKEKSKGKECCAIVINVKNMRHLTEYLFGREKYISIVTYVLIFALNVVIFGLGVSLFKSDIRISASIASYQLMEGGFSLHGIYAGVIVLSSFNFYLALCWFYVVC